MRRSIYSLVAGGMMIAAHPSWARTLRYGEVGEEDIKIWMERGGEDTLEFRAGDEIKVRLNFAGEIFEGRTHEPTVVTVKRGFHLKNDGHDLLVSWDGQSFRPLREAVGGQISADASGNPVSDVNLMFDVSPTE